LKSWRRQIVEEGAVVEKFGQVRICNQALEDLLPRPPKFGDASQSAYDRKLVEIEAGCWTPSSSLVLETVGLPERSPPKLPSGYQDIGCIGI
jgi:hypothetical protein